MPGQDQKGGSLHYINRMCFPIPIVVTSARGCREAHSTGLGWTLVLLLALALQADVFWDGRSEVTDFLTVTSHDLED